MNSLWTEKYRPNRIEDYVWVDVQMKAIVEEWLEKKALPHALFSGRPGTGKTSLAKLLFKTLDIPSSDILYINASRERHIDAFQDRIVNFVDAWAMGPTGLKYILLDECLHEDEHIQLADGSPIALKNMRDFHTYAVKSLNMTTGSVENDTAMVVSRKDDELFELELDDGRTVRATSDHPFLVRDQDGLIVTKLLRELAEGDSIVSL